jgi:hypothetical protein
MIECFNGERISTTVQVGVFYVDLSENCITLSLKLWQATLQILPAKSCILEGVSFVRM